MWKTCWDCLLGDGIRPEESHSIQLNGNVTQAPPWPTPRLRNEKMFILPRRLNENDTIIIHGETLAGPKQLTVALVTGSDMPDHSNVACQLQISYYDPDKIHLQIIENGNYETVNEEEETSNYFTDSSFKIQFLVRSDTIIDVRVGDSHLESVQLRHDINRIKFLSVHGDVNRVSRLDFNFG
ncbi:uncharacterized protein LOC142973636 isoform X2 [Anticarsia gemmatalis]|uniref:uncharacterized protein LOC142973636 isoform X2 n=1 Tax=Anticarsia gemmatalis TaxID=129554 RepID=UPI003F76B132